MAEATSFAKDVNLLAKLGYKQEFKRDFKPLELFGLGFSIVGVLPSIAYVVILSPSSRRHRAIMDSDPSCSTQCRMVDLLAWSGV
jgi:hypothetical protein